MPPSASLNLFADLPAETRDRRPVSEVAWINAHCDGGARGNPGPAGYGAVLADESGQVLAELSEYLGLRTNNFAEYSGLLGCLAWALQHQHPRLRVVSDSELMVKQIQGRYKVKNPDLKLLYEEAKRRIAQLEAFEITHALRHKNKDADRLANEAMDRGPDRGPDRGTDLGTRRPLPSSTAEVAAAPGKDLSSSRNGPANGGSPSPASPANRKPDTMLRGFTRDGVIHILGSTTLPNGIFVKIIPE